MNPPLFIGPILISQHQGAAARYYELDRRYPDGSTANDAYRCLRAIVTRP